MKESEEEKKGRTKVEDDKEIRRKRTKLKMRRQWKREKRRRRRRGSWTCRKVMKEHGHFLERSSLLQ